MHKFLLTVLIVSVAWFATGQTTTLQPTTPSSRTNTATKQPSTPPRVAPTTSTYNPNPPAPRLTPKSGTITPESATNLNSARPATTTVMPGTTAKSGATHSESSMERSTSNTTTRAARPSRTASKATTSHYNGNGTARTVTTPVQKTVSVKPPAEPVKINWMTLEEALEKSKTEKRKIFVDVMTDWCGWCKRMDETTFTDPAVAQYLNEHFYAVKFNAEQTNDIVFQNKTYHFKSSNGRGYHELAAEWLNNRLSFPTSVFSRRKSEPHSAFAWLSGCHEIAGYPELFRYR